MVKYIMNVKPRVKAMFSDRPKGRVNLKEVAFKTGLSYPTVIRYYSQPQEEWSSATLEAWVNYLKCEPSDILEKVDKP